MSKRWYPKETRHGTEGRSSACSCPNKSTGTIQFVYFVASSPRVAGGVKFCRLHQSPARVRNNGTGRTLPTLPHPPVPRATRPSRRASCAYDYQRVSSLSAEGQVVGQLVSRAVFYVSSPIPIPISIQKSDAKQNQIEKRALRCGCSCCAAVATVKLKVTFDMICMPSATPTSLKLTPKVSWLQLTAVDWVELIWVALGVRIASSRPAALDTRWVFMAAFSLSLIEFHFIWFEAAVDLAFYQLTLLARSSSYRNR